MRPRIQRKRRPPSRFQTSTTVRVCTAHVHGKQEVVGFQQVVHCKTEKAKNIILIERSLVLIEELYIFGNYVLRQLKQAIDLFICISDE